MSNQNEVRVCVEALWGLPSCKVAGREVMRQARVLRKDAGKQRCLFVLALLVIVVCRLLRRRKRRSYMNESHLEILGWRFRCFETYLTSLNPGSFHVYTRFYPHEFESLYQRIAHRLDHSRNHIAPITGRQRLATLCRFLGHGSSFTYMSQELCLGACTVMKVVYEVAEVVVQKFFREVFLLPTRSTWAESAEDFANMWKYPRGVAALDGKHFECFRPSHSGSPFYNCKGYYSIVLLALSDAQYRILMFDLGSKGKSSDAGIFQNSPMRTYIESHLDDFPPPVRLRNFGVVSYHNLADQGFGQKVHIQRPFNIVQASCNTGIAHFNKCFSRQVWSTHSLNERGLDIPIVSAQGGL
ncbi:hypothetical protein Y032_0040g166 [Ancylostoma ceylanicum]|uniref:DDE Tnp4 domain-containing protein n=1 Tax=Ancylostoma ceylanicum TaxID=53326 RepID=A0A016UG98_9BILA|nr:hypothetical protein Y032_0040g166 [Ancylostoma ceylanicum]